MRPKCKEATMAKADNATQARRKRFWAEHVLASAMDDELASLEERLRAVGPSRRVSRHVSVALNREVGRRIRQLSVI